MIIITKDSWNMTYFGEVTKSLNIYLQNIDN
jgi:hypothetical protein